MFVRNFRYVFGRSYLSTKVGSEFPSPPSTIVDQAGGHLNFYWRLYAAFGIAMSFSALLTKRLMNLEKADELLKKDIEKAAAVGELNALKNSLYYGNAEEFANMREDRRKLERAEKAEDEDSTVGKLAKQSQ